MKIDLIPNSVGIAAMGCRLVWDLRNHSRRYMKDSWMFLERRFLTRILAVAACLSFFSRLTPAAPTSGNIKSRPSPLQVTGLSPTIVAGYGRTVADANGPASTGADELLALVDHLKSDKFHLVGTAGGGFVAVDFAISYPQRLRSLTLLCSTADIQDKDYIEATHRMRPDGF
jgi:hypothetical protein